jgi:signal transduction histidine kinase
VVAACARVSTHAAESRGLTLDVELPAKMPDALTDREALRRVVCSLIENAVKYTPSGGRIRVGAGVSGEPGSVEITVKDTGVGILAEDLPLVFEKFFRGRTARPSSGQDAPAERAPQYVDAPGVGLGLYLARSIITQLGGSISVESPPKGEAQGTVFTVRLPAWRGEGSEDAAPRREDVGALTRG